MDFDGNFAALSLYDGMVHDNLFYFFLYHKWTPKGGGGGGGGGRNLNSQYKFFLKQWKSILAQIFQQEIGLYIKNHLIGGGGGGRDRNSTFIFQQLNLLINMCK